MIESLAPFFLLAVPTGASFAATAQEPLWREAAELHGAGRTVEAWRGLLHDVLERVGRGGLEDAREAAEVEVACRALVELVRRTEAWSETRDALDGRPWADDAPPSVAFLLDALLGEAWYRTEGPERARAIFDELGFVGDWLQIGPFDNERGGGFDASYPPEEGFDREAGVPGKEREVSWRPNPCPDHPLRRLLLHQTMRPNEQALAYLATAVRSDADRDVVLRLGSTCSLKVFLNGVELLARKVERPYRHDQDRVVLPMRAGWNQLLLKVGVEEGSWTLGARLTELDGRPARELAVDSSRTGTFEGSARAAEGRPAPEAGGVLSGLEGDASAARSLALWHRLVHAHDRVEPDAREAARRAAELEPDDVVGRYLLAAALEPEGETRSEMAINPYLHALREVIELDPEHLQATLDLAWYAMQLNPLPRRADELTRRALEIRPESWRALTTRARWLSSRGRDSEAELLLRQAAETLEGRRMASGVLIRVGRLRELGRTEEVHEGLKRAFVGRPIDGPILEELVELLVDRDNPGGACFVTDFALAASPFAVGRMLRTAGLVEHAGLEEEARDYVKRALAVCPEHVGALLDLARLDSRRGDLAAVDRHLAEVLRLEPGNDRARRFKQLLATETEERFETPWRRDAVELAALPRPEAGQNDVIEVLDRTTVHRLYPDGAESRYEHFVVRALNLAGVQALDTYNIGYPRGGSLQVLHLRVIHPDGRFERAPAPTGGDVRRGGTAIRPFDLPPLAVGDVVDVEYRVDETRPDVFGEYFGTRHVFHPDHIDTLAPTRRAELVVIAPEGVPLYFAERRGEDLERSQEQDAAGRTVYRWVARDLERPPMEGAMPRREELVPLVEVTTYSDWESFGRWWWSFIEKEFVTSPDMREKVAELTGGLEAERDQVRAILRFVGQEIRYNAWSFGTHGYEPFSASTIFKRRFGDCKDKSILLRQLLAEIGVEAVPVLIRAQYSRSEEPLDAAMVGCFNHCIAYVTPTAEREGYYLDATADRNPMEYLRADDQGAHVLHVTPEGAGLHRIPYSPPRENGLRRVYQVELAADGRATVELADRSNGRYGVRIRHRYGGEQGDIGKLLSDELVDAFGKVDFQSIETSDLEDLGTPAELDARFTAEKVWTSEGDNRGLPLAFDELGLEGLAVEPAGERTFDLCLDRPLSSDTTVRWSLPDGARIARRPPDVDIEAPGLMRYRLDVEAEGDRIEVRRRFELLERRIPVEDYGDFRRALQEVRQAEERTIAIVPPAGDEGERGGR